MFSAARFRGPTASSICFALVFVGCAQAADTSVWANLRDVKPGEKIRVTLIDRTLVKGSFSGFTDESISLKVPAAKVPSGEKAIGRAEVATVSRHGGKRLRHAGIGAAIGGAAGAGLGAAAGGCDSHSIGPCFGRGYGAIGLGAFGALVGFVVGLALPSHAVIYRAPGR